MGNVIASTDINNIGKFKSTNILTDIIYNALNDDNSKKRVCCLGPGNNVITKALPYIAKDTTYVQVGIIKFDVFSSPINFEMDNRCIINDVNYLGKDEKFYENNGQYIYYGNASSCNMFYTQFCANAKVLENSTLANAHTTVAASNNSGAVLYTNFKDCNCQNSLLGKEIALPNGSKYDAINVIYTMDKYCAFEYSTNFKTIPIPKVNLCLNISDINNVIAKDGSNINLNQIVQCNNAPGSIGIDISNHTGLTSTNQAGLTTDQKDNNKNMIIIVIIIVIILSVVGSFLILKKK